MEDFDEDWTQCPRCTGWGEIDCHFGGDLCVCDNYGQAMCPMCGGEGEVSVVQCEAYLQRQAEHQAEMMKVWERVEAERASTENSTRT